MNEKSNVISVLKEMAKLGNEDLSEQCQIALDNLSFPCMILLIE